jgi:para-aminobenzoate synthetase component I
LKKNDAFVEKMNMFGAEKRPFFILVDYEVNKFKIFPLEEAKANQLLFDFGWKKNFQSLQTQSQEHDSFIQPKPLDYALYARAFQKVMSHLQRGDTYLINLTFPVDIQRDISLKNLFSIVRAKYKVLLDNEFLCFSPETFVKMSNNRISTYPMKGTIDASIENALERLLSDEKELAEHYTIVDLLRNDLNMIAKNVSVSKFRYVEYLQTNNKQLLQTSSEICGELPHDWMAQLGTLFYKLLPAGSICGAPKKRTCEIIEQAETTNRGYYTGVAGLFDGEQFDSCVLIRFIEQTSLNTYRYRAGGGITTQSRLELEYNELMNKVYVPLI